VYPYQDGVPDMVDGLPVLTCLQVREDTIQAVVPGSIQGECDKCSHKVWISKSGQAMMASEEVHIRCLECVQGEMADGWDGEVKAVPGAAEEIQQVWSPEQILRHLRGLHGPR